MSKIIAFGHQKGVGKDEIVKFCFDILRPRSRALRIVRRGFADKMYDMLHQLYDWAGFRERAYYAQNPKAKSDMLLTGKTVRQMLIEYGQHLRKMDNDIWVNATLRSLDFDVLFVTDLRFPHEFESIKKLGGTVIRITRPGLEVPTDEADTALNGWEDQWHDEVHNDGDLGKLHSEAERIVARYLD